MRLAQDWRESHRDLVELASNELSELTRSFRFEGCPVEGIMVVARLKRFTSIINKLRRQNAGVYKQDGKSQGFFPLSTMTDIAGIRVILPHNSMVYPFVEYLEKAGYFENFEVSSADANLSPMSRRSCKNYMARPKSSGYRSVHFRLKRKMDQHIQNLEIQIRGMGQHVWATALENADNLFGTNIKSELPSALASQEKDLARLFFHIAPAFGGEDDLAIAALTPESFATVKSLDQQLDFHNVLQSLSGDVAEVEADSRSIQSDMPELLVFNTDLQQYYLTDNFVPDALVNEGAIAEFQAQDVYEKYKRLESYREKENAETVDIVLVFGLNQQNLAEAFPNYVGDYTKFSRHYSEILNTGPSTPPDLIG
ncbi:MAG: RelA/SpoT domain-containing protein [Corynebacterium sp.]|nr:RelA/SpoT domain-containing protein [Corynebacterium sp.]